MPFPSFDGDRISQTVDSTFTTYVLDVATPLTMVLSETSNGSTLHYWQGLDVLTQSDGSQTEYLAYDGLGSVRQVTDSAGLVEMAQTFDPYGNLYSRSGVNPTKYAFTGEAQDDNGLLFLRARYYSAPSGRFLNTDPSRQEQNPYQYSLSNPVMHTDPTGWCTQDDRHYADCVRIATRLEQRYEITIFWPNRFIDTYCWTQSTVEQFLANKAEYLANHPNTFENLPNMSDAMKTSLSDHFIAKEVRSWTFIEMANIQSALTSIERVLTYPVLLQLLRGGIIAHDIGESSVVGRGVEGLYCDADDGAITTNECAAGLFKNMGFRYGIFLSWNFWSNTASSRQRFDLIHEVGHRVHDVGVEQGMRNYQELRAVMLTFQKTGSPSGYAAGDTNGQEYWAEAFAGYVWEATLPGIPPYTDGPGMNLDAITNPARPDITLRAQVRQYLDTLQTGLK